MKSIDKVFVRLWHWLDDGRTRGMSSAAGRLFVAALLLSVGGMFGSPLPQHVAADSPRPYMSDGHPAALNAPATSYLFYFPWVTKNYPPANVFGVQMGSLSNAGGLSQLVGAGTGWTRGPSIWWPDVEAVPGSYNWGALASLEAQLTLAAQNNLEVIVLIRGTPAWAQKVPGYSCGPVKPEALGAFAAFVRAAVQRYSAAPYSVKYWELVDEPDIAPDPKLVTQDSLWGCWGDSQDTYYGGGYYAQMLKAVYPQIKAANPQGQVLVGGLLLDCDPNLTCAALGHSDKPPRFLEGILKAGGGPFFDGVSFHAYDYYGPWVLGRYSNAAWATAWNTTGPVARAKSKYIKNLLSAYGVPNKFLMNTESALICTDYSDGTVFHYCSADSNLEPTKAYYVAEVYAAALADGLRANVWFSLLGWRYSALLNSDLSPRPAFVAYQFGLHELLGARFTQEITEYTGVKGYKFDRGDRQIWIIWSQDGASHPVTLPSTPLAIRDVYGNSMVSTRVISVGISPLYLEW